MNYLKLKAGNLMVTRFEALQTSFLQLYLQVGMVVFWTGWGLTKSTIRRGVLTSQLSFFLFYHMQDGCANGTKGVQNLTNENAKAAMPFPFDICWKKGYRWQCARSIALAAAKNSITFLVMLEQDMNPWLYNIIFSSHPFTTFMVINWKGTQLAELDIQKQSIIPIVKGFSHMCLKKIG